MYFTILELIILFQSSTERLNYYIQKISYEDDLFNSSVLLDLKLPLWLIQYKLEDYRFDWENIKFRSWFANEYINKSDTPWYHMEDTKPLIESLTNIFLPLELGFEEREFSLEKYNKFKQFLNIIDEFTIPRLVLEAVYIYSKIFEDEYNEYLEEQLLKHHIENISLPQGGLIDLLTRQNIKFAYPSQFKMGFDVEDVF